MAGAFDFRRPFNAALVRSVGMVFLVMSIGGCNLFGSGQQLKVLRAENDRLISEFRAQRDRLAVLQETNTKLEARVGEAEKLLARSGQMLPSSRISQATPLSQGTSRAPSSQLSSNASSSSATATPTTNGQSPPPYVPPSVPSLPGTDRRDSTGDGIKWRPLKRQ